MLIHAVTRIYFSDVAWTNARDPVFSSLDQCPPAYTLIAQRDEHRWADLITSLMFACKARTKPSFLTFNLRTMPFSPTDSRLFGGLFGDKALEQLFSDEQFIDYLIEVELGLAIVQGELGVIPAHASQEISTLRKNLSVDYETLRIQTERAGFPVKELVRQMRETVHPDTRQFLHWGATTQDIMDTALVLQLRAASNILQEKLHLVIANFSQMIQRHRTTLMVGRTHGQQALPITFGLKAAGWIMPLLRHIQRLNELKPRVFAIQHGGAAGTLAASGPKRLDIVDSLAKHFNLWVTPLPWHAQRDSIAEFAGWLSLVSGSLAKIAQDIILLAQNEVGEIRESTDRSRGSSSTMPQKSNPVVSELIIAAARSNASLLSAMHNALVQEHERGTHGLQLEWLHLPQMAALTGTALNKAIYLSEHLHIDEDRMRLNVEQTQGLMLAEAAVYALRAHMDASAAKSIVTDGVKKALSSHRHLIDVLAVETSVPIDWEYLKDESNYLGATDQFIDRVLGEVEKMIKN